MQTAPKPLPLALAKKAHEEAARYAIAWSMRLKPENLAPWFKAGLVPDLFPLGSHCRRIAEAYAKSTPEARPLNVLKAADTGLARFALEQANDAPEIILRATVYPTLAKAALAVELAEAWQAKDTAKVADVHKRLDCLDRSNAASQEDPDGFTAADLMNMEIPEPRWSVKGYLPAGLSILAGKPKVRKSWLALGTGVAIASGGLALGAVPVEAGSVLYLALEDTKRRLKDRLALILGHAIPPESLHLRTTWPRADQGGLAKIEAFLIKHPDCRLVIIDTWQKFKPLRTGKKVDAYEADYSEAGELKALADRYGVAALVIHHLRKAVADDIFDTISGSTGLTGAADASLVLEKKGRGQADAVLHITGRDVEEAQHALRWSDQTGSWQLLGDAEAVAKTTERQQVIDVLRQSGQDMSPKDIADLVDPTGKSYGKIKALLWRMSQEGEIKSNIKGKYSYYCNSHTTVPAYSRTLGSAGYGSSLRTQPRTLDESSNGAASDPLGYAGTQVIQEMPFVADEVTL